MAKLHPHNAVAYDYRLSAATSRAAGLADGVAKADERCVAAEPNADNYEGVWKAGASVRLAQCARGKGNDASRILRTQAATAEGGGRRR